MSRGIVVSAITVIASKRWLQQRQQHRPQTRACDVHSSVRVKHVDRGVAGKDGSTAMARMDTIQGRRTMRVGRPSAMHRLEDSACYFCTALYRTEKQNAK